MVDAVVSFAVDKLGNFLSEEIGLPERVRNDVEWLKTEFVFLQSFLADVAGQQNLGNRADALVSEVEAIAKDAVTILDKYIQDRTKCGCIRMYGCIGGEEASLHSISDKIVSLKARVEEISRRRERYGISNNILDEGTSNNLRMTRSFIKKQRRATPYLELDELFVGFQDVLEALLDQLMKDEPRRSIVSIYGMGGLGKTTLARQLYNTDMVMQVFPNRAWLCVSQEFNTLDLLRDTYKSFQNGCSKEDLEKLAMMDEEDLERLLRYYLKDKKYVVVFDDVWDKEAWASIKRAFPDCKNGSRVIVTTRIKDVAERVDDRTFAHSLRFLTPTESWDLFCKKVSYREGHINWCSSNMLDLGRSMVDKCGGLPLAIMTLGGLLLHKGSVEGWIKVKKDLWGNLKNDSIEIGFILSLSYDNLSKELKQCFLYIGLFPEDYIFDSERLMCLWMADKFFPHCDGDEFDIACQFLEELIGRSLIQVAMCYRGIVGTCKIHDLVRDLAIQKCNEVNFLNIFNPLKQQPSLSPKYAIHAQFEKFISHKLFYSKIQSLFVFDNDSSPSNLGALSMFKKLEVLDMEGLRLHIHVLPDAIGDLVHLKYLGLNNVVMSFPPSIGNLSSLQTLRALIDDRVRNKFPREISKLKSLRHLYARPDNPFHFNTLTSLRTLLYLNYDQFIENDVSNLKNLRELAIEIDYTTTSEYYTLDKICQLTNLQILSVVSQHSGVVIPLEHLSLCPNLLKLRLEGEVKDLASLEKLPPSITMLTLNVKGLEGDPMPILGRMPNLTNLKLMWMFDQSSCEADGFLQLEFLYLEGGNNLKSLKLGECSMPVIRGLEIEGCPNLTLPERLRSIPRPRDYWNRKHDYMFFESHPYLLTGSDAVLVKRGMLCTMFKF